MNFIFTSATHSESESLLAPNIEEKNIWKNLR